MYSIDFFVQSYLVGIRTPILTEYFYLITILFDFSIYFLALLSCVAFLVYLVRKLKYALLFLTSIFSGTVVVFVLKSIFNINRPLDRITQVLGQSFPSYHATIATIFFIMLIYIFDSHLKNPWRFIFNFFCILSLSLVAFSRLYLGAHWLSDVLFGIFLGGVISYFSIKIFENRKNIH